MRAVCQTNAILLPRFDEIALRVENFWYLGDELVYSGGGGCTTLRQDVPFRAADVRVGWNTLPHSSKLRLHGIVLIAIMEPTIV